jgi:hypothetical protein
VDATYHIAVDGGTLQLSAHHVPAQRLTPVGPDTFRAAGGLTLHFEKSTTGGAASAFSIEAGRVRNIRFARR